MRTAPAVTLVHSLFALMVLMFFFIPLASAGPRLGALVIPLIGLADLVYLLVRSHGPADVVLKLIPLLLLILVGFGIKVWARNTSGHPLGISLAAGFLFYAAFAVLAGVLEFFAVKQFAVDLPMFFSLLAHWRGNDLRTWLSLAIVIPLAAHILAVWMYVKESHP